MENQAIPLQSYLAHNLQSAHVRAATGLDAIESLEENLAGGQTLDDSFAGDTYIEVYGQSDIARRLLRDLNVKWTTDFGKACQVPKNLENYQEVSTKIKHEFRICLVAADIDKAALANRCDELLFGYFSEAERQMRKIRALRCTMIGEEDFGLSTLVWDHGLKLQGRDFFFQRVGVVKVSEWSRTVHQDFNIAMTDTKRKDHLLKRINEKEGNNGFYCGSRYIEEAPIHAIEFL